MADLIPLAELLAEIDREIKRVPACAATLQRARSIALTIPTVDAALVVHAKWVANTDDFTPKKRCTNCGYNKPMKAGEGIEQEPEAFCPACGAMMDENGGNSQ
jgi:rubrerythrin